MSSFKKQILVLLLPVLLLPAIGKASEQIVGNVEQVRNDLCYVDGWTKDQSITDPIKVKFYKDGPVGQGTLLAEITAYEYRGDLPFADKNHGFMYQFNPDSSLLDDDRDHNLYVYGYNPVTQETTSISNTDTPPIIHCKPYTPFNVNTNQPYTVGAWYYTGFSAQDSWLSGNTQKVYGTYEPWGGVRQYATGQDPWGLYNFVPNPGSLKTAYAGREPLLGFYENNDQSVMDAHIEQAASHGLSYFAFYWYWNVPKNQEHEVSAPLHKFLSSSQKGKMKFMLAPIMLEGSPTLAMWQNSIVPYIVDNYIADPSYLTTTDGRPIITDFDLQMPDLATHQQALTILRNAIKAKTGKNPLILGEISDNVYYPKSIEMDNRATVSDYDGYQCFGMGPATPADSYDNQNTYFNNTMNVLKRYAHTPCTSVDFDYRPWYKITWAGTATTTSAEDQANLSKANYFANVSPLAFAEHLLNEKKYMDQHPTQTAKMFTIYAWNEWGEGGVLEPSKLNQSQYLDVVQKTFGLNNNYPPIPPPLPPPPPTFSIGSRVQAITNLGVRNQPTIKKNSKILCTQRAGALGTITSGPSVSDGSVWWKVNYDTKCDGWSAESYLANMSVQQY